MGANDLATLDAGALVSDLLREFLAPPRSMRCSEWADEYRHIAKGPEKGRWRTSRTPYLREPMDCTDPENPIQKVVMQFATQLGKSEVLYNSILKRVHLSPSDMMFVQPTLQDAKDHSRTRFMPTARAMPHIASRLPDARSRDETNTWQTKEIHGGATLFFAGANSARSLASKPLGFVSCDEIDGYPLDVDGEGDPLALIWERMSNFPTRKLLLCSTPTLKDFSRVEAEYLASDRRRYWVPCPHCAVQQLLVWGADSEHGIKWLKTESGSPRAETSVYICAHCGAAIEERHKTSMLAEGVWKPDAPGAQRGLVAGFHLNKLHSPLGWKSWAMLVEDWAKAQEAARAGDVSRLKTFVNTSLAETWEEQGDRVAAHELQRRAPDIPLGVVHWGLHVRTMGVDVQGDRIEAFDWAWGRGMTSQLVERRVFYGDPALPETESGSPWAQLTEYRRTPVHHASGRHVQLLACFIDSGGHHTQQVYAYARAHQHAHVYAIKGASIAGKAILGKPSDQDVTWRGERVKRGVKLWPIGTDTAKATIYGRLRLTNPGPGYVYLSKHHSPEVFDGLTAERLVTRYVKGHAKLEWVKPAGKRNEPLDGAVYALAAAHYAGVDRWRDGEWSKWERRTQVADLFEQPPPPAGGEAPGSAASSATSAGPGTAPAAPTPGAPAQQADNTPESAAPDKRPTYMQQLLKARRKPRE
jgi:phage terminase large subunit GpA-like protein